MWALGGGPWTPNIIIISTYKPQQPRVNNRQSRGEEGIGGLGLAESKEPRHRNAAVKSTAKTKPPPPPSDKQNQLSGSAVLMALQRATVQKAKKKHSKRDDDNYNDVPNFKGVAGRRRNGGAGAPDLSNVRPLCIKSEWSDRLGELETRLRQELLHI